MDLDNSGALSIDEFMSLPELQQNPLVQRVIDIFDADGNGEVDFKEFIHGVSQFSVKGDKLSKLKFAFRIYDMDNDGFISNGELFQVSKTFFLYHCRKFNGFFIRWVMICGNGSNLSNLGDSWHLSCRAFQVFPVHINEQHTICIIFQLVLEFLWESFLLVNFENLWTKPVWINDPFFLLTIHLSLMCKFV